MKNISSFGFLLLTSVFSVSANAQTAEERGHQVFDKWCAACHDESQSTPGTAALRAKYNGALPALLEEVSVLCLSSVKPKLMTQNWLILAHIFPGTTETDQYRYQYR